MRSGNASLAMTLTRSCNAEGKRFALVSQSCSASQLTRVSLDYTLKYV